jgi:DNA-binding response OmpR family regulator
MLERETFDIVLADMGKPLFLGLKVIEQLRSLKVYKPVCLIASKEDHQHQHGKEVVAQALKLGAAGYFERPVSPHFICHRLKCILDSFAATNGIFEVSTGWRAKYVCGGGL